ncbi:innexin unc-9-like [Babylonia areolata]|uniref:innexin unc-9-like n=1 Tax=Babylonia areolata TaxID=304850 RepID=UPI003FD29864
MWESILEALSSVTLSRGARDDDAVDQLHHFGTVAILAAFAALIGMNQYVGDPIHCLVPAEFQDSHQDYTENLCWVSHMYYVPMDEELPRAKEDRELRDISFYRWVVVLLLLQCLLFKFPNIVWKELKGFSGINVQKIVNMADEATMTPPEERDEVIGNIAHFIDRWLYTYRSYKKNVFTRVREKISGVCCFVFGRRHGTYLTGLYLFTKVLYLANVVCQFLFLSAFLGFNYFFFGYDVLVNLKENGEFRDFDHFPRVVMCDIHIRQLQNDHIYTVQCVLSINLFVEKSFALLWFWLFFLTVVSVVNISQWAFEIFFSYRRDRFIQKYLLMLGLDDRSPERKLFKTFVSDYLRDDGIFLLRSVGNNSSDLILLDLVQAMWTTFKKRAEPPVEYFPMERDVKETRT